MGAAAIEVGPQMDAIDVRQQLDDVGVKLDGRVPTLPRLERLARDTAAELVSVLEATNFRVLVGMGDELRQRHPWAGREQVTQCWAVNTDKSLHRNLGLIRGTFDQLLRRQSELRLVRGATLTYE